MRELHWKIGDRDVSCRIDDGTFHIEDQALPFRILDATHIEISGKRHRFYVIHDRDITTVWLDGHTYRLTRAKRASVTSAETPTASGEIRALMPGKLLRLDVVVGDTVAQKQTVGIMESMKMESALVAPITGRISEIRFKAGQVVEMGEVVMLIEGT